jgi:hypothetical protein
MMLAGFCGLGALAFRRAAPQPARPLPNGAESGEIALGAPFNALGLVNGPIGKRGKRLNRLMVMPRGISHLTVATCLCIKRL